MRAPLTTVSFHSWYPTHDCSGARTACCTSTTFVNVGCSRYRWLTSSRIWFMHFGEADESSDLRLIRQWIMIHSATHHLSPTVNQRLPRLSILTRVNVLVTTVHFYHAMLCIARTMLSQDVCPSVCLSHAGIVLKRLNVSSNFFHRRVATLF